MTPDCPNGVGAAVSQPAADTALAKAAQARKGKESSDDEAIRFECQDPVSKAQGKHRRDVTLNYRQVLGCLTMIASRPTWTLSECLRGLAIGKVAFIVHVEPILDASNDEARRLFDEMEQHATNIYCNEISRQVDMPEDALRRNGVKDLIPVLLVAAGFAGGKVLAGMAGAAAAAANAAFVLMPVRGSADDEACADQIPTAKPPMKCTDTSGCPDRPEGAEDPGASSGSGGDVIPPGSEPPRGDGQ